MKNFVKKKNISFIIWALLGIGALLSFLPVSYDVPRLVKINRESYFADSILQEFKYRLSLCNIPLGYFTFDVAEEPGASGRPGYLVHAAIRPWDFLNTLSRGQIGVDFISRIDRGSGLPYSFEQTTPWARQKGKKGRVMEYHHDELFMVRKDQKIDIEADTKDPVAAVFWLMRQDYHKQRMIKETLNINPRVYLVIGRAKEFKVINVAGQDTEVVRLTAKILKVNQEYRALRVNPVEVYLLKQGEWHVPLSFTMKVMGLKIQVKMIPRSNN
ncbi:MAG: hypothetical protein A2787_02545 [Omnitrophica WOR_2 bacterium RIFCSPHIGHO2_01_FULL_48_9]|nr:MAG: hypothetical protein A3D10_01735 [Omnitrophica WOR_2 bacterium RIFCSPHIGHO2_02_FULL_48_11]OGX32503.1 MAG: hypothetical protein A2787_02545 [Omnitrophica WOR_2 bacterium RIFCSPHIGHO2_01_FULL_48_9]